MDVSFDGIESHERIFLSPNTRCDDGVVIEHLRTLDDLSEVEIKINKKDLSNTFLDEESIGNKKILSFNRIRGKNNQWLLPKEDLHNFLPVKNKATWNIEVDGIKTTMEFWIHYVSIKIDSSENERLRDYVYQKDEKDTINIKIDLSSYKYKDESDSSLSLINLIEDSFDYKIKPVDVNFNENNSNYKIIPVGANWTENRHIVGYYNVITNEYQSTPAYDLIKAANNSTEPHFLILDEMNLSHVERYFADFLSAIESGEKIPLYGEEELTLPSNLFIIGTVNVDETTYMFSPKVLDRANVIEFETYSASDYMNDNINLSSPSGNIEYLENPLAGNEIRSYGIDELREIFSDVVIDDEPFWDVLSYEINSFQNILSKSRFDFGFRVINEIVRFMAVAWEYERKPTKFANWTRYFDACIKQKMLPKLHGSEKIIGETLEELSNLCSDSVIGTEDMVKYPESFKKLEEMKKILRKQRYVSFIN